MASASTSSMAPTSTLLRLPAALLSHVCGFLSPLELLMSLAQTADATRGLLTPSCFSHMPLEIDHNKVAVFSSAAPPPSLAMRSFQSRVLAECDLRISIDEIDHGGNVWQVFPALDCFPACRSLTLHPSPDYGLTIVDSELQLLLHHPTVMACSTLSLSSFERSLADEVMMHARQDKADIQIVWSKRKRSSDLTSGRMKLFSWADVRLPAVTRLQLDLYGGPCYLGGAAFLTAHTALLELLVTPLLVSVDKLAEIFADSSALPNLTHFSLEPRYESHTEIVTLTPLLTALATTVVSARGAVRPMTKLSVCLCSSTRVFAAAAPMAGLTSLSIKRPAPDWLREWTSTQELLSAFPLLERLYVHTTEEQTFQPTTVTDMFAFLQSMADRPLQLLDIGTNDRAGFSAAAMTQLARCQQLRKLCFSFNLTRVTIDWRDTALFVSFTAGCWPYLHTLELCAVRLSAESVAVIASATPQLRQLSLRHLDLGCHPAVLCAIIGGYCEHIERIDIKGTGRDRNEHDWTTVQASDVVKAYQSAIADAGRFDGYRPYTRLHELCTIMCWCTPASVWHALLALLRFSTSVSCASGISCIDPLMFAALSYLPSLASLASDCMYPPSFGPVIERRCERTGRYRYISSRELRIELTVVRNELEPDTCFILSQGGQEEIHRHSVVLRPHSGLFAAYQQTLSEELQTVLARWAAGDFRAGDEQFNAAETYLMTDSDDDVHGVQGAAALARRRRCPCPVGPFLALAVDERLTRVQPTGAEVEESNSDDDDEKQQGSTIGSRAELAQS